MADSDPPHPSARSSAAWLTKARQDLAVAELIANSELAARWAGCFHAQQAVEKALKGLLVARRVDFPKSHSLERLADLLDEDDATALDRSKLARLTPWAVAGRYPEDISEPTQTEARELVAMADAILHFVAGQIAAATSDGAGD
jgi:HEPN domain-containing protein